MKKNSAPMSGKMRRPTRLPAVLSTRLSRNSATTSKVDWAAAGNDSRFASDHRANEDDEDHDDEHHQEGVREIERAELEERLGLDRYVEIHPCSPCWPASRGGLTVVRRLPLPWRPLLAEMTAIRHAQHRQLVERVSRRPARPSTSPTKSRIGLVPNQRSSNIPPPTHNKRLTTTEHPSPDAIPTACQSLCDSCVPSGFGVTPAPYTACIVSQSQGHTGNDER